MHSKLLILGAGPAGYTAGIYAARAMLNPLIVTGLQPGGQLMITTEVENYPGFATPVMGPDLMETMAQQAINMGAIIRNDTIVRVDLSKRPFRLTGDSAEYTTDALIIATGAQAKWLGLPSEEMFHGRGVSACATCDAPFFRNKNVIVVGGGNTAVEEALFLANHAAQVTLVHRRDSLRAEMVLQKRLFAHPKISVRWNSGVDDILGTRDPHEVSGVILRDLIRGTTETYPVDGVFVAIGHAPATTLFEGQLPMKPGGYLSTDSDSTATAIPGVFAAGDVTDDRFRQAVTAAGMGCMAALEAERFLHLPLAA
ncbi:thioredoxin-disulfide reductase [Brucellaceae bacterium D45D]